METVTTTAIQGDLEGSVARRANQNGRTAGSSLTAAMRLSYCACFALCAFLLCKPTYAQDRKEFWPEVDAYVNLSSRTRLFVITALSSDQDTRNVQGEFGPNLDFFLRPFARIHSRDKDPAKSKLLTFRVGYRYLPIMSGEGANENRAITELTSRFKLPLAILMSDRNRFDFRFVSGQNFSWRYRNRLSLERIFLSRTMNLPPTSAASSITTAASTKSARTHSRSAVCFLLRSIRNSKSITKIKGIVALRPVFTSEVQDSF